MGCPGEGSRPSGEAAEGRRGGGNEGSLEEVRVRHCLGVKSGEK